MDWLKGKKTYLAAAALVVISGLAAQGIVSHETAELLTGLLAALGLTTARSGASADVAAHVEAEHAVNPPGSSRTGQSGRATLATLVSIAVILALASALAGCVSQEAKDGMRQLDQDLADLDAHPDSPRGPALVHAMHGLADRECEAFGVPTATAR